MKKVLVLLILSISAILAAPAIDQDVRDLENNEIGEFNQLSEKLHAITGKPDTYSSIPTMEEITRINKICMEETKVEEKTVRMLVTKLIIPDDPKYPNFLACSYRKQHYLNQKGEIEFQNIIRFLSKYYKKEDLKVLEVCGELKQTPKAGDNALNALKCILPKLINIEEIFDE